MGKKLWNVFTYGIVLISVLLAAAVLILRGCGWQAFTVLSGSMEPTLPTGSLIWVRPADPDAVEPGTVITFLMGADTVATHRVTERVTGEDGVIRFRTKGDSNASADGNLVHPANLIGIPVIVVPGLGTALQAVRQPPGSFLAAVGAIILVTAAFLPDLKRAAEAAEEKPSGYRRKRL